MFVNAVNFPGAPVIQRESRSAHHWSLARPDRGENQSELGTPQRADFYVGGAIELAD